MLHHNLLAVSTMLYLLLFFLHILYFVSRTEKIFKIIWTVFYFTFFLHTGGLVLRWIESHLVGMGHAPLTNFYESLLFFAWCMIFLTVLGKRYLSYPVITFFVSIFCLFLMAYASLSPSMDRGIKPLIPALKSNWLHVHVFTCFIAYALFFIAFVNSILILIKPHNERVYENITYKSVMVGFPMLTAGILSGAVWAHYAWGSYWSWDPKETWSLITWIIYAIFLHARISKGLKGKSMAFLAILGFLSVIFTYIGVNFLLSGLHSYA